MDELKVIESEIIMNISNMLKDILVNQNDDKLFIMMAGAPGSHKTELASYIAFNFPGYYIVSLSKVRK